jgi:20S proteasome alpha/beta subunit
MTLVIACSGKDFVVMGADSRVTYRDVAGNSIGMNLMDKLIPVSKHVAILLSGEAGNADELVERFKLKRRGKDGVTNVADEFTEFCRQDARKAAGVPMHPNYFPDFSFIVAGLDKRGTKYVIPRFYTLDSLAGYRLGLSRLFEIQGKPLIARYLFCKEFEPDMIVDKLCRLVARALYDTAKIDGEVGGDLKMARIEADGYHSIPGKDIQSFIEPWELGRLKEIMKQ